MKAGPEKALFDHYLKRISWTLDVHEVIQRGNFSNIDLRKRESEILLTKVPEKSVLVALDEGGVSLNSREFAEKLRCWRDDGHLKIAFVIGGPEGLDSSLCAKADLVMSFGRLTWPHMLVRSLLAEQIYRTQAILSRHPYHRD